MIMSAELTPLAQLILDTIASAKNWVSRKDIAYAIGRPNGKLSPYDLEILDKLESTGRIYVRQEKQGVVRFEYQYRIRSR